MAAIWAALRYATYNAAAPARITAATLTARSEFIPSPFDEFFDRFPVRDHFSLTAQNDLTPSESGRHGSQSKLFNAQTGARVSARRGSRVK